MEEQIWVSEIKKFAFFMDPTALVEEQVGIWKTNHRSKVFAVDVSYETKRKFFGIFKEVTATITYRKSRK
jgi:hypothetical protein